MLTENQIANACQRELANSLERIKGVGPERVVVHADGEAVLPHRAKAMGKSWDVVFVRKDGWTLGASRELEQVAVQLWPQHWIARYDISTGQVARAPF